MNWGSTSGSGGFFVSERSQLWYKIYKYLHFIVTFVLRKLLWIKLNKKWKSQKHTITDSNLKNFCCPVLSKYKCQIKEEQFSFKLSIYTHVDAKGHGFTLTVCLHGKVRARNSSSATLPTAEVRENVMRWTLGKRWGGGQMSFSWPLKLRGGPLWSKLSC